MKGFAFLIGINEYQQPVPSLRTPVNDVRAIGKLLENDFSYEIDYCLNPSRSILSRYFTDHITKILHKQGEVDNVLIYFAGHGYAEDMKAGMRGYILPADATRSNDTWQSMDEIIVEIKKLQNRHVLLILDCCFGGAIRWVGNYRAILGFGCEESISSQHYKYFTQHVSRQILTSTAPKQRALDFIQNTEIANHSPFAHLLIKGLTGSAFKTGSGIILLSQLYSYIQEQLPIITEGEQNVGLISLPQHEHGEFLFPISGFDPDDLTPIDFDNPYRGLASYEFENAKLFFGRTEAIKELIQKANTQALTVVVGASGTGKSSLVKAGVVPKLIGKVEVMEPGRKPQTTAKQLPIFDILVIDQFEQLVTQSEKSEKLAFFIQIDEWLNSGKSIIITLRIDFEKQLEIPIKWEKKWTSGRYLIPPFKIEELREIIITPALRVGRFIDPINLIDEIIDEVIHYPGSLPLLSFTMQQLFEKCKENLYRNISKEDYEVLGGVSGALQSKADNVINSLSENEQSTMRNLMLRMVSLYGGDTAGKRVLKSELEYNLLEENKRVDKIVKKLVHERLINVGRDSDSNVYYEPSHDALIRVWGRMQEWIKEFTEEKILLLSKLEGAVYDYQKKGNKIKHLWYNSPYRQQVIDSQKKYEKIPAKLNKAETMFIQKSAQVYNTILFIIWLIVFSIAFLAFIANHKANEANNNLEQANQTLRQLRVTERERLNQGLEPLIADAEIFERAKEYKFECDRYKVIEMNLDSIYRLTKQINFEADTFKLKVEIDSVRIKYIKAKTNLEAQKDE